MNGKLEIEDLKKWTKEFLDEYTLLKATRAIIGDEKGEGGFICRLKNVWDLGGKSLNSTTAKTRRLNAKKFDEYIYKQIDFWEDDDDVDGEEESDVEDYIQYVQLHRHWPDKRPPPASETEEKIRAKKRKIRAPIKCSNCKREGHNKKKCPGIPRPLTTRELNPPLIRTRPAPPSPSPIDEPPSPNLSSPPSSPEPDPEMDELIDRARPIHLLSSGLLI